MDGYQFPLVQRDRNNRGGGKIFFVIFLHIDHQIAKIEILLRKSQIHEIRP